MSPINDLLCGERLGVSAWSSDLDKAVLDLPAGPPAGDPAQPGGFFEEAECGNDEPRLVAGEPEHFRNLFVHDDTDASDRLVNVTPSDVGWPLPEQTVGQDQHYFPASFLAGSDDLSHVVFEEELALTEDAPLSFPGNDELYEWSNGEVRLVTYLPDGTPVHGSLAGATRNWYWGKVGEEEANVAQFRHAVSADGSRVFFEAEGGLYVREDGMRTDQADASQGPGTDGGGEFMVASADGARVFFTDESRLTDDSTAVAGSPDLYEYNVESGALDDLTVDAAGPAGVLGVPGASADGSRVYVVAKGVLTSAPNSWGDSAVSGAPNLYLLEGGGRTFVATLDAAADECDWTERGQCAGGGVESGITSRLSADGSFLGFNSVRRLTDFDNTDAHTGRPDLEIYLFDAAESRLVCASCDPSGARPTAGAAIRWPSHPVPGPLKNLYPQRNVSDRGQVFFETNEALLPADVNDRRDVYEYSGGSLHLISTGTSEAGSYFVDAATSGDDVFFSTAQRLLPRDQDFSYDYYDARVDGGFPEPPEPLAPCDAESCHGGGSEPLPQTPGTASLHGHGNMRPSRNCRSLGRRARSLDRRASRARRSAGRRAAEGQARTAAHLRHNARRLTRRARRLHRRARRCSGKATSLVRREHCRHRRTRRDTNASRRAVR